MRLSKPGQSIVEYACIAGLIAGGCLLALTSLDQSIAKRFFNMVASPPPQSSAPPQSREVVVTDETQAAATPLSADPDNTLNENRPSDAPAYPADFKSAIQTMGGNGATQILSEQIRQVGEYLLKTGQITPDQANAFFALANQGNRIAGIEKLIEDAVKSGDNVITFEGRNYTPFELSTQVGWVSDATDVYPFDVNNPRIEDALTRAPDNRSESMQQLLDRYQELTTSGALNNPQVAQAIGTLTTQIAYLSEVTEYSVSALQKGGDSSSLQNNYISSTTYWNADKICGAGAGETIGTTCQ